MKERKYLIYIDGQAISVSWILRPKWAIDTHELSHTHAMIEPRSRW